MRLKIVLLRPPKINLDQSRNRLLKPDYRRQGIIKYGITVDDFNCLELVPITVTVADPDFIFWIRLEIISLQKVCFRFRKSSRPRPGTGKGLEETRWFHKRVVLVNAPSLPVFGAGEHPNVPSFRFLVLGNIRMYPRSCLWYRATSAKTTLLETTLLRTPEKGLLPEGGSYLKNILWNVNEMVIKLFC